jgi:hypothetical protein
MWKNVCTSLGVTGHKQSLASAQSVPEQGRVIVVGLAAHVPQCGLLLMMCGLTCRFKDAIDFKANEITKLAKVREAPPKFDGLEEREGVCVISKSQSWPIVALFSCSHGR